MVTKRKRAPVVAAPTLDRFALVLDELDANAGPLELVLRPTTALALAGLVHAGLKHPQLSDAAVAPYGDAFLSAVRVFFKDAPAVLELLDDGDAKHKQLYPHDCTCGWTIHSTRAGHAADCALRKND